MGRSGCDLWGSRWLYVCMFYVDSYECSDVRVRLVGGLVICKMDMVL